MILSPVSAHADASTFIVVNQSNRDQLAIFLSMLADQNVGIAVYPCPGRLTKAVFLQRDTLSEMKLQT